MKNRNKNIPSHKEYKKTKNEHKKDFHRLHHLSVKCFVAQTIKQKPKNDTKDQNEMPTRFYGGGDLGRTTNNPSYISGRKNGLRKLLRIPYRRFKAGFSVRWLWLLVARVLNEMHEVRTFAPCKAFLFDMFAFFSSLENYFGFRTTNVKGKTDHSVSLRWNKRFLNIS